MLTGKKIIMILDCSFTNLAAAAAVNEMFWRGIKVFGRYENNAGYFLLLFRHERFDIEKMAVFSSLVWFPPETTGGGGVDRKCL